MYLNRVEVGWGFCILGMGENFSCFLKQNQDVYKNNNFFKYYERFIDV